MNELFRRLRYLMHRRRFDQELESDMEFHREMAAREGGVQFGNTLRLREEARDAWGWTWIERLSQDLRYAARMLRRSPGFTLAAVIMLALGIGVNVAAFGFFNLMVLRPLPVREPATLLRFERRAPQSYASVLPYPEMAFFREHSRTLSAVLALNAAKLTMEGEEKPISAHFVTANFFAELGATATLGRMLDPAQDEASSAEPVVVLSHAFWERHFGADPLVIGKTVRINSKLATVIGVASREFSGLSLDKQDVWAPITEQPYFVNGGKLLTDFSAEGSGVQMWGRLQPGLTPKIAEEELQSLAAELRRAHPQDIWEKENLPSRPGGYTSGMMSGSHHGSGTARANEMYPILALVGTLVLLILAVACANLGSLLLARGVAREREMAIRIAVGAGRGRLIRQLFTESLVLALLGAAAGLAVGYLVLRGLMVWTETPAWLNATPDWRVVVFAVGMGFAAAILFGLMPALHVARQRHRATFMRQVLIAAQVAASCVLLIVAGLLVRALHRAISTHPGFEYQQVISIDPGLATHGYSPAKAQAYLDELKNRLRNLPGVESVSLADPPPLGHKKIGVGLEVDGRAFEVQMNHIDPEFFQTMKIPILRGRSLLRGDSNAIIVSKSLAALVWPGQDSLGKTLPIGDVKWNVVGVAGNARLVALQDSDAVEMYQLAAGDELPSMVALVKTSGPPEGLARSVGSLAKTIDPKLFPEIQLLKSSYQDKVQSAKYSALSAGVLGFTALLLACVGIVGLVGYAVSQRTKEIGIRMALGARPSHVLAAVLGQLSRPVAAGLLVGVGGAAALSRILRQMLYGVR